MFTQLRVISISSVTQLKYTPVDNNCFVDFYYQCRGTSTQHHSSCQLHVKYLVVWTAHEMNKYNCTFTALYMEIFSIVWRHYFDVKILNIDYLKTWQTQDMLFIQSKKSERANW